MSIRTFALPVAGLLALASLASLDATAQSQRGIDARAQAVIDFWTPAARAAAIPRDLVIDERGLGYLRLPDRTLVPYGHNVAASTPVALADTAGPIVSSPDPAAGTTIGASYTFKATVTDPSGIKSVSFKVQKAGGLAQSFTPAAGAGGVYSIALSGFTDGSWSWWVVAKDNAPKGGNTTTTTATSFTVSTGGGGGGGGGGTVSSAEWTSGGGVQTAAGRLYFEMPQNARRTRWAGYVCSGTVVTDGAANGRSIILTASHCVYDDSNKAFARNVLFIPDQAASGTTTDLNCANDQFGCWVPSFGVVDVNWTTRVFPDNVAWDYAFYVVSDTGAHSVSSPSTKVDGALDAAVGTLDVQSSFSTAPTLGSLSYALGYSYDQDPKFMYCTDNLANEATNPGADYWLAGCGLTGGSSGGPWMQSAGSGPIISVNSWGYTNQPGMAGPKLFGTSASCVFSTATNGSFGAFAQGEAGYKVTCP